MDLGEECECCSWLVGVGGCYSPQGSGVLCLDMNDLGVESESWSGSVVALYVGVLPERCPELRSGLTLWCSYTIGYFLSFVVVFDEL